MLSVPEKNREATLKRLLPNAMSEAEKYYIRYELTWNEKERLIKFFKEMDWCEQVNNIWQTIKQMVKLAHRLRK